MKELYEGIMERPYNGWKNLREFAVDSIYSNIDKMESALFALTILPVALYGAIKMIIDVNRHVLSRRRLSKLEA